jgi:methylmalonyl-CoA mutase cobalamin-binding subunit
MPIVMSSARAACAARASPIATTGSIRLIVLISLSSLRFGVYGSPIVDDVTAGRPLSIARGPGRPPQRSALIPEPDLPAGAALVERGRRRGAALGRCPFLERYEVPCEAVYKRRRVADGALMLHAQIGYRDPAKTRRAYAEIHGAIDRSGGRVDRYGICLDWSMGYPRGDRRDRPRGTGLILEEPEDFARLVAAAPVAPHFGDFVLGMPSALENTTAALAAGATAIGNLGQYFTFRLPGWTDDVGTTAATVEALGLIAAQPVEILVHSNLDDGFAALFHDLACSFGAVLLERHIVDRLIGARVSHCFGHTFSNPVTRLAFQRALASTGDTPGTMIYGNTTLYRGSGSDNYAALGSYLTVDAVGQRLRPSGHALNPVPITEAERIPDIDEIIAAHRFALRLIERSEALLPLVDVAEADRIAERLVAGGERFRDDVLAGLAEGGFEIDDPFVLLLALRRIGARRLEAAFGPGAAESGGERRVPLVPASTIAALETAARKLVAASDPADRAAIAEAGLVACVGATDVHEYGKLLVQEVLQGLGVRVVDLGVHAEPAELARAAADHRADLIAISTYNGVALDYVRCLRRELDRHPTAPAILIGGRLNQLPDASNSSLPVDVEAELRVAGAVPCAAAADLVGHLAAIVRRRR